MCGLRSKSHSCRSTCRTHCYISELFSDDDSEADTDADDDIDEMTVDEEEDLEKDRQAALEALVPGISSSEYGKMPSSFHRNSQRVSRNTAEREEPQPFDGAAGPSLPRKLRQMVSTDSNRCRSSYLKKRTLKQSFQLSVLF